VELVVVGDNNLGATQVAKHVAGHKLVSSIVAIGVIGLKDAKPVLDRQAGGDHKNSVNIHQVGLSVFYLPSFWTNV